MWHRLLYPCVKGLFGDCRLQLGPLGEPGICTRGARFVGVPPASGWEHRGGLREGGHHCGLWQKKRGTCLETKDGVSRVLAHTFVPEGCPPYSNSKLVMLRDV